MNPEEADKQRKRAANRLAVSFAVNPKRIEPFLYKHSEEIVEAAIWVSKTWNIGIELALYHVTGETW